MKWEDYAADFDYDGSLRDIYVLETTIADWQTMFNFLYSSQYKFLYHFDGIEKLPNSIAIFEKGNEKKGYLSVEVGDVTLSCHFFYPEDIEFDFDPREVRGEEQAEPIFDFMRQLGRALDKEVILTPENYQEIPNPIFKFSPLTQKVEYFSIKLD